MSRRKLERNRQPLYPEHPKQEHDWRLARLRAAMKEDGISVLVLARNPDVFYVTGTRFVFVRGDAPRGLSPQTTAIVTENDLVYCQRFGPFDTDEVAIDTTWANTFEFYDDETELVNILEDYGVGKGQKIGTEWGAGLCVGINPIKFMAIVSQVERNTGAQFVDATGTIKKAMAVKSQIEIERMRFAVRAAANAMESMFREIEVGMNALDVSRRTRMLMLEAGADTVTHAQVLVEDGSPRLGSCDAVDRPVRVGYFHMDIGCSYRRYGSDIHRGIFLGRKPTADEKRLYDCRVGVSELMDRSIKDGVCVDDVLAGVDAYVQECGCEIARKGNAIFAGHSIGLETYQGPSLASSSSQPEFQDKQGRFILRSGMMFTYEIAVRLPGSNSFFNIEDDIVVTNDGVENMNASLTRELRVKA